MHYSCWYKSHHLLLWHSVIAGRGSCLDSRQMIFPWIYKLRPGILLTRVYRRCCPVHSYSWVWPGLLSLRCTDYHMSGWPGTLITVGVARYTLTWHLARMKQSFSSLPVDPSPKTYSTPYPPEMLQTPSRHLMHTNKTPKAKFPKLDRVWQKHFLENSTLTLMLYVS